MKAIENKRIGIIGAGPGGLTLARLLQMNGAHVMVYERDANRTGRSQGATLDLHHDSGLMALSKAGLMDAFRAHYRPGADKVTVVDGSGKAALNEFISEEHGPERPEIDRGPLRGLLLDSLQSDTVRWGSQFVSLTRLDDGIRLEFADGSTDTVDLVVAADGANSKIRAYITPIRPVYSGVTIIEGHVHNSAVSTPQIHELLDNGKICALGDEKSLFVVSKGDGSLSFYTGHNTDETWWRASGIDFASNRSVLNWFKTEFTGWGGMWDALFENADPAFVPRPQYYFPLDQTWDALSDLTMIGDAAHVMPPYAGEGVNMAMLDALELAEHLLSDAFPDTQSAIAAFETVMRSRASSVTEMTLEQTAAFHSANALPHFSEMFGAHAGSKDALDSESIGPATR